MPGESAHEGRWETCCPPFLGVILSLTSVSLQQMHLLFSTTCEQCPLHGETFCLKVKPTLTVWTECQNWDIKKLMADPQRGTERLLNGIHKSGSLQPHIEKWEILTLSLNTIAHTHTRTSSHTHSHTHWGGFEESRFPEAKSPHILIWCNTPVHTHYSYSATPDKHFLPNTWYSKILPYFQEKLI